MSRFIDKPLLTRVKYVFARRDWYTYVYFCAGYKNNGACMVICDEFWDDFIRWAVPFAKVKPDADIYDVFVWIRDHQQGAKPYSDNFLAMIDKEVERELGPWI